VTVRLLGALKAVQTEKRTTIRNDRLIGVPETDKIHPGIRTLKELDPKLVTEIKHFLVSYNRYEGRRFVISSTAGPAEATKLITAGMQLYRREGGA
jgi:inorganic pyrophosphatase